MSCTDWRAGPGNDLILAPQLHAALHLVGVEGSTDQHEEHGQGKQLLRFRVWPRWSRGGSALAAVFAALALLTVGRASVGTVLVFGLLSFVVLVQMTRQCAASVGLCLQALDLEASGPEATAELLEALMDSTAKARSRIHVVVG